MKKKTVFRLLSAVLLTATLLTFVSCREEKKEDFDYATSDLSGYVTIDPSVYRGKVLSVGVDPITEESIDNRLLQIRATYKDPTPVRDGAYFTKRTTACGDIVYIYYRGYRKDDAGKTVDLYSLTSNFSSSNGGVNQSPSALEIGSGEFIPGFELGLVGKNPGDYEEFYPENRGTVSATDRVVVTYTVTANTTDPEHFDYTETAFIDLNDPTIEETYGIGFAKTLEGMTIGMTAPKTQLPLPGEGNDYVLYSSMIVNFVFRESEKKPITVETHFPTDYEEKSLAGKTVFFEVYITKTQGYDAPEVDDTFLAETLKLKPEELPAEGTAEEKLRTYIRESLEIENRSKAVDLLKDKMWEFFYEEIPVKAYPEDEINRVYVQMKNTLTEGYRNNITAYGSLDEYMRAYFGLEIGQDWQQYMRDELRIEIGQEIILFQLMKAENCLPTGEAFDKSYADCLEMIYRDYEKNTGKTRDTFESDEAYEAAKATTIKNMEEYYGKDYFTQGAYFEYASDRLIRLFDLYVNGEAFSLDAE